MGGWDYGNRCINPQLGFQSTSPHPLNQRQRRLGISIDHAQQRPRWGIGRAAVLFPIAHGADGHAQALGELRLAEPGLGADRFHVWPGGDAALAGVAPHEGDGIFQSGRDALEMFVLLLRSSFFNTVVNALNSCSCSPVSVSSSDLSRIKVTAAITPQSFPPLHAPAIRAPPDRPRSLDHGLRPPQPAADRAGRVLRQAQDWSDK